MIEDEKHVICLYEETGLSARPWAENGYTVFCYDILHEHPKIKKTGEGFTVFMPWDARDPRQNRKLVERHRRYAKMVLAYPPCTDLAVSGAAHFENKKRKNPNYRQEAMSLVFTAKQIGEQLEVPFCIENPVSVISSEWRKPDYIFDPYEFGGYLPEDDTHPLFPEYIKGRDAYPKKTCYWVGNNFVFPAKKPVLVAEGYSLQHKKLGGKSQKTKTIRSASPRGVAEAIFIYNSI